MKRTRLADRTLPDYTQGEELMNMITHTVGVALAVLVLVACVLRSVQHGSVMGVVTSSIYGGSMIALYAVSSIYHGLRPCMGKKVLQVIDHCTIYFLIAGTYTPVMLCAMAPVYPGIAWGIFGFVWLLAIIAATFTAIDLRKYWVFSMICYIGMGWVIILFWRQAMHAMTTPGFLLLLWGGISYTVGSILYGLGSKLRWMHSIFHIFVVMGSLLQFLAIYMHAL